jgi:hypothetical protein
MSLEGQKHTCSTCKDEFDEIDVTCIAGTTFRCKVCNNHKTKLNRTLQRHPSIDGPWQELSKDKKDEFRKKGRDTVGLDLAAQLKQYVSETTTETVEDKFETEGVYMDEADIREKFKSKPEQAKHIMETAANFVCKVRNVKLYSVPQYKYISAEDKKRQLEVKRTLSTEEGFRKAKKTKVDKTAVKTEGQGTSSDQAGNMKELTPKQVTALSTTSEGLQRDHDKLKETLATVTEEDWKNFPAYVRKGTTLFEAKMLEHSALMDVSIANKKGIVKELKDKSKEVMTECKEWCRKVNLQKDEIVQIAAE